MEGGRINSNIMANTNKALLPPNATGQTGASGTYWFKGYITAEEYAIDLQGKYGLQVYDVMRKSDPTVHALLTAIKNPILGVDYFFEPASKDPKDIEIADHATYEFFDRPGHMDYWNIMREGYSFMEMGFFVGELVYDTKVTYKGRSYVGMKTIASRKQRSILKFQMDSGGDGVTQILPSGGAGSGSDQYRGGTTANIPRNKLLYVVNDQEGDNYFGVSLLRYAYKPWKIKDGLEIMGAIALENMALGIPYIKKGIDGKTVDPKELDAARERLRQQRANEEAFLEFPASIEIGWMDMKGHTTQDVLPYIQYHDGQILLTGLSQFLLLGSNDGSGSRAVSQDHSRLFVKASEMFATQWDTAWQRDVVNRWVDLNYSDLPNGYPKFKHSTISDEDVGELATAYSTLLKAGGVHPDRDSENRARRAINMPELSEEDYEAYDKNIASRVQLAQTTIAIAGAPPISGDVPAADPNAVPPQPSQPPQPGQKPPVNPAKVLAQAKEAQRQLMMLVGT
jgi:hypothetical protein